MGYKIQLWSLKDLDLLSEWTLKVKGVYTVDYSYNGQWIAIGSADKRIRIWDLTSS